MRRVGAATATGGGAEGCRLVVEWAEGVRRDTAGEGDVVVDEEFEEMVEFVGEGVNGAGLGSGRCEGEGERPLGFTAGWEGDVLEVPETVFNLC